jgi:hypothetical protein
LLENVVRAPSEVILEIAMTNTSEKDIFYGVDGWPGWRMFHIEIRDLSGVQVPMTPAGERIARGPTGGSVFSAPLKPGRTLRTDLILNRVFDLSRPGEYRVEVSTHDGGLLVKARPLTLTLPATPRRTKHARHHPFSIAITTPFATTKGGWQIPVSVAVKNVSQQELRLAVWDGRNPDATIHEPDEFGSGIKVTDRGGKPAPLTRKGEEYLHRTAIPNGGFLLEAIRPGRVLQEIRCIGSLIDITKPGNYAIQVELTDPTGGEVVKSNKLTVAVISAGKESRDNLPVHPPFVVTIRLAQNGTNRQDVPLTICQTNISDHGLTLDNATYDYELSVLDEHGNEVPLTEAGRKAQAYWTPYRRRHRPPAPSITCNIPPGHSLCGIENLAAEWDLSKPGTYSVQIIRDDYPDEASRSRTGELPMVRSNILDFVVSPQPADGRRAP